MITESQRRALTILRTDDLTAKQFARKMWPDSPGWKRCYNCGPNGATFGLGMWLSAGSYLAKLSDKGWVYRDRDGWFKITKTGVEALEGK